MIKQKISDQPEVTNVNGLYVLVTDANNQSKKFRLDRLVSSGSIPVDLENIIYAIGGSENDFAKEKPSVLRGDPYDNSVYRTETDNSGVTHRYARIPRLILYYNGHLYDNAPQNYDSVNNPPIIGEYEVSSSLTSLVPTGGTSGMRIVSQMPRTIRYYLTEDLNPCTGYTMGARNIEYIIQDGVSNSVRPSGQNIVIQNRTYYYFNPRTHNIEENTPFTAPRLAIASARIGITNMVLNSSALATLANQPAAGVLPLLG